MQDERRAAEFVKLLTSHQRRLYLYILTFLPHPTDAEEVLQEANTVLWSKSGEFEPGTSFAAWAHKVAWFEVLAFRKRSQRDRLTFSDELLHTFAQEAMPDETRQNDRRLALVKCLEKLPDRDRDLVARRYTADASVQQIASDLGRPLTSIYRSLERARLALMECIQRTLSAEERDE